MIRKILSILVLLTLVILIACDKNQPPEPPIITLEKLSGAPGAVITINHDQDLSSGNAEVTLNGSAIQYKIIGNDLAFMVPEISSGDYKLEIDIDNNSYEFLFSVLDEIDVADPDQYLQNLEIDLQKAIADNRRFKDSLIVAGLLDSSVIYADEQVWNDLQQRADAELASLTLEQKEILASLIEANKDWLDQIDAFATNQYGFGKVSASCESIRLEGKQATANGQLRKAIGIAVRYKWCQALAVVDGNTGGAISKMSLVLENASTHYATEWLTNMLGRRIEKLGNEIANIGNSSFVAQDMEDWGEFKKTLTWKNGELKPIFVKMRFRSPLRSDIGTAGTLGDFASVFDDFIAAYDEYLANTQLPLVWRPEFMGRSRVVDFITDLSIPVSSINNPEVILVNTQVNNNDEWEVIFATDDSVSHDFSFDIVYDDGHVQIQDKFSGRLELGGIDSSTHSTITDPRDGEEYKVIKIGSQVWFAENLRYSQSIPYVSTNSNWASIWNGGFPTGQAAWCHPYSTSNDSLGKLYNWYAVNTNSLCPSGWHIPSDDEWAILIDYLGGDSKAGGDMKSLTGWKAPNTAATNSSSFSGLPAGARHTDATFFSLNEYGFWWSSTEDDVDSLAVYSRFLKYDTGIIYRAGKAKSVGMSCRAWCIGS